MCFITQLAPIDQDLFKKGIVFYLPFIRGQVNLTHLISHQLNGKLKKQKRYTYQIILRVLYHLLPHSPIQMKNKEKQSKKFYYRFPSNIRFHHPFSVKATQPIGLGKETRLWPFCL